MKSTWKQVNIKISSARQLQSKDDVETVLLSSIYMISSIPLSELKMVFTPWSPKFSAWFPKKNRNLQATLKFLYKALSQYPLSYQGQHFN